jgi:hypothetical protein
VKYVVELVVRHDDPSALPSTIVQALRSQRAVLELPMKSLSVADIDTVSEVPSFLFYEIAE